MPMNARLLRPLASGGFDPRSISNMTAWFDAQDSSTVTLNSGRVSQWRSIVGGWEANQVVAANQPLYQTDFLGSKKAVRGTGSGQALTMTAKWGDLGDNATKQITHFYVFQADGNVGAPMINEAGTGTGHQIFPYFSGQVYYDGGTQAGARVNGAIGNAVLTGAIYTAARNDAFVSISYGDSLIASRSNATGDLYANSASSAVFVNNNNTSTAEALFYDRFLSDSEVSAVRSYLQRKYGL